MIWEEFETKYGNPQIAFEGIADKMEKSKWLQGITLAGRRKSDGIVADHKDYLSGNL